MATHFSTLAWKIPWMEEPHRLQSMESQRVRHNWTTSLSLFLMAMDHHLALAILEHVISIDIRSLSQCTSPYCPVSCMEPGLAIYFIYGNIHVLMLFSQIIPPSPSPTESKRLFYMSVSLLLSCIQGYRYHLSKFHIYALSYCIGVFLSGLLHSV